MSQYTLQFNSALFTELTPIQLTWNRRYNQLDMIKIHVLAPTSFNPEQYLLKNCQAIIKSSSESRFLNGIVTEIKHYPKINRQHDVELWVSPQAHCLTRDSRYHFFKKMSATEIIEQILKEYKVPYSIDCRSTLCTIPVATQYNESSLHFINRLCQDHGLYYYFKLTNGQYRFHLQDHLWIFIPAPMKTKQGEPSRILNIDAQHSVHSTQYMADRYQVKTPDTLCRVETPLSTSPFELSHYEYPHSATNLSTANKQEQIRHASYHSPQQTVKLQSEIDTLCLGGSVPHVDPMRANRIIEITHSYHFKQPQSLNEKIDPKAYTNDVLLIPENLLHYRFNQCQYQHAPGVQRGKVFAKNNCVEAQGSAQVNIRFTWEPNTNRWIRSAQTQAGQQQGLHFHPRHNSVALIQFNHEDPNAPQQIGQLFTKKHLNPIKKDDHFSNGILTQTLHQTKKNHALLFDDTPEHERLILNSSGNQFDNAQRHRRHKIKRNYSSRVNQGNQSLSVKQGHQMIQAKSIVLKNGASEIKIDNSGVHFKANRIILSSTQAHGVARLGDQHSCPRYVDGIIPHQGGKIVAGSSDVFVNNKPVARVGDQVKCHHAHGAIKKGNNHVLINNKPIARHQDKTNHNGQIINASTNVKA
jgi:type VI secretion system secreted protein VgrG